MRSRKLLIVGLLLSPLVAFFVSMMLGSYGANPSEALAALVARLCGSQETVSVVIADIRLPRVVTSLLVGMALAMSGATLQGVLRNPLVDPYILGLSSGAAFGAALAIAVWRWIPVPISAFVFALVALAMTYFMARTKNSVPIVNLVLSGVITSAVFTALLSIVQITSHEKSLQAIVLWTMGSFNGVTWSTLKPTWLLILLGCFFMIGLRWRLNVLTMGETEAKVSGMHVERYRVLFIVLSALVSALSVSMVGVVALLGLIVPHIVRMLLGPDHRVLIPVSAALGAALMEVIDTVARTATGFEIPVSIITTLVGAPVFLVVAALNKGRSMAVGMSMESVSIGYGQRLVIRDVTDTFPAGKITALLGANGCGKSTLLSAIAGLTPVHSGAITVDTPNAVLGFVTQAHAMSFPFDVVDVVLTGRVRFIRAFSSPAPKDVDAAHSALDMLGVGHLARRQYTTLSGGERQMVMIARALAQEPDILLLDEPTTYLDLYNQQRVLEVMDMLRGQGITLLATLHDPNHALALADHAVTLRRLSEDDSRTSLISSGAPSDIVHAETIRAMYSLQAEFITTQRGPAMLPWMNTVDS